MPRHGKRVCKTCGREKPTYLFDKQDEDCIVCSGKNVLKPGGRGRRKDRSIRPKPGEFWRHVGTRQTRKEITGFFEKDGTEYVQYLFLEGTYEGQERTVKYVRFRVNHTKEDNTNRHKHGWEPWKHTNWWKENQEKRKK